MPGLGWHSFRCTFATESADKLSEFDRQKFLGHATALMTAHYTGDDIERRRVGAEKIAASVRTCLDNQTITKTA
ncbi:MAG TPA: hypothetical protein VLW65_24730 [Bryobacteraceae bacterium]|nr:hypothetical protein [Bryobacteraceae bacterium]